MKLSANDWGVRRVKGSLFLRIYIAATLCLASVVSSVVIGWGNEPPRKPAAKPATPVFEAAPQASSAENSLVKFQAELLKGALSGSKSGNVLVSPVSLSSAFVPLYAASAGETRQELAKAFHYTGSDDELLASWELFQKSFARTGKYFLGAGVNDNQRYGVKIYDIIAGSAAEQAGLATDDLILSINERPVRTVADFSAAIDASPESVVVQYFSYKQGGILTKTIKMSVKPTDPTAGRFDLATALWVDDGVELLPPFLSRFKNSTFVSVQNVPLRSNPQEALKSVNGWAEQKTHGLITEALNSRELDSTSELLITSAAAFSGNWAQSFEKRRTKKGTFRAEQEMPCELMHHVDMHRYGATKDWTAISFAVKDCPVDVCFILPEKEGDAALVSATLDFCSTPVSPLGKATLVDVTLPRFETSTRGGMADLLKNLGVKTAFTNKADFKHLTGQADAKLGSVHQSTRLRIDEEGIAVAAVTSVNVVPKGGPPTATQVFKADRPFGLTIVDRATGVCLFSGVVRTVRP